MAAELAPGTWELEKSENFDEYMKTIGVGYATRVIANKLKPSQTITITDGVWKIVTSSTFRSSVISFTPGVPFDEVTADGRTVKTICSIEGNKLIQNQKAEVDCHIVRTFSKDSFVMTLKAKDVLCTRHYKRMA